MGYCTVLHCTALYCTVLYCTVLDCTVLYWTVLCCTALYSTIVDCTVLYCTILLSSYIKKWQLEKGARKDQKGQNVFLANTFGGIIKFDVVPPNTCRTNFGQEVFCPKNLCGVIINKKAS